MFHSQLEQTYRELEQALFDAEPGSIIMVYGPTGVGKTTLLEGLQKRLHEAVQRELEEERGRFPVVYTRVANPHGGKFDWKDYFHRLLIEMDEPSAERNKGPTNCDADNGCLPEKTSGSRFRLAAERALKNRKPLAVFVDDAQHFGAVGSGQGLLNQHNVIKSVADATEITHVLSGTYELLPFRDLNGQLARRSFDIHFPRYRAECPDELEEFLTVLKTFQQQLPLPNMPDLIGQWDFLFERSLGCVGILKVWLSRSLAHALRDSSRTLTCEHLERCAPPISKCLRQLAEAIEGERQLEESEGSRSELRQLLNLELGASSVARGQQRKSATTKAHRRRERPGTRKPVRDPVGTKAA